MYLYPLLEDIRLTDGFILNSYKQFLFFFFISNFFQPLWPHLTRLSLFCLQWLCADSPTEQMSNTQHGLLDTFQQIYRKSGKASRHRLLTNVIHNSQQHLIFKACMCTCILQNLAELFPQATWKHQWPNHRCFSSQRGRHIFATKHKEPKMHPVILIATDS